VTPIASPGAPPSDVNALGLYYDFGPSGTTFNSPVTITLKYDPATLPAGADQSKLYIAWWDAATGQWISLPSTVDLVNHTVTATVTHFSVYSVMAPSTTGSSGIGAWVIAGIVAGCVIVIGLIAWMVMRRRRTA
jgi:hypothetical protein